jgi:hypothetical protein
MKFVFASLLLLAFGQSALAKEFEIFDGQFYNGLYYPVIDNIEWGEQLGELPHMEFHIHSKDKPIEVSVVPGDKNGKPVLWIMYELKFRNERVCRHVLAPAHFKEGMKLYTYRDNSDPDYDNVYFSSKPIKDKKLQPYTMPTYQPCTDEMASNKPGSLPTAAAQPSAPADPAAPASAVPAARVPASAPAKGKGVGADYENNAVPFSF